jgi:hypothetical protein
VSLEIGSSRAVGGAMRPRHPDEGADWHTPSDHPSNDLDAAVLEKVDEAFNDLRIELSTGIGAQ